MGLDARELSPGLVHRITFAAAETRSFERAELVLGKIADAQVSANTIQRVVGDVGRELAERRDADSRRVQALAERPETPPELAVVECDGAASGPANRGMAAACICREKAGARRKTRV